MWRIESKEFADAIGELRSESSFQWPSRGEERDGGHDLINSGIASAIGKLSASQGNIVVFVVFLLRENKHVVK